VTCQFEVKPMPYQFCESCMFNGCYPWNTNPALLCMYLGGILPTVLTVDNEDVAHSCETFKQVTDDTWQTYLTDAKAEAKQNEKTRLKAIDSKILTNRPLPAESIQVTESKASAQSDS